MACWRTICRDLFNSWSVLNLFRKVKVWSGKRKSHQGFNNDPSSSCLSNQILLYSYVSLLSKWRTPWSRSLFYKGYCNTWSSLGSISSFECKYICYNGLVTDIKRKIWRRKVSVLSLSSVLYEVTWTQSYINRWSTYGFR